MRKSGSDSTRFVKKNDWILLAVFLLAGLLCLAVLKFTGQSGSYVKATVEGEEIGIYDLSKDQVIDLPFENHDYSNQMVIKDGRVSMQEANCADKICVNHQPISKDGETIVCLPHKLVLEIVDDGEKENEGRDFDTITN